MSYSAVAQEPGTFPDSALQFARDTALFIRDKAENPAGVCDKSGAIISKATRTTLSGLVFRDQCDLFLVNSDDGYELHAGDPEQPIGWITKNQRISFSVTGLQLLREEMQNKDISVSSELLKLGR